MSIAVGYPSAMIRIRPYRHGDRFAVLSLERRAVQAIDAWRGPGPWDDELRDIDASFRRKGGIYLVATDETGLLVGTAALRPLSGGKAEVTRMRVRPDRQGQGIGGQLLDALEACADILGFPHLVLHTTDRQAAARKLYASRGFEVSGHGRIGRFTVIAMAKQRRAVYIPR
jgi:GNAT superfamily N-acetyltransferase